MESRIVTTYDEFLKLRVPWGELHRETDGSLFQLHDWLATWWKVYGALGSLNVYTFWNEGLLVGVIPGFKGVKQAGPVRFRRMSLLGEEETYGEYFPLVDGRCVEEIAQAAASLCSDELKRGDVDVVDFHGFPQESEFMKAFVGRLSVAAHVRHVPHSRPHFVIEGATNGETYLKMLSKRRRRGLRRDQRLLEAAGAEVEVVTRWDGGKAYDDLVRLHTTRWVRDGQSGRFGSSRFTEFLRSVTECLMPEGSARIYFTRSGQARICGLLVFDMHRRNYQYLIGRDPGHALMRFSVGEVLAMRATIDAFDEGSVSSDLMGGDYQHKQYTGITTRWYSRATAIAAGAKGTKGYLYWGGLAMRDAVARGKRRWLKAKPDGRLESESI